MIAFFGASVTAQKTGYAKILSRKLNDDVRVFGYGGMHLNNAAICYIDRVLEVNPSFCFVDWFSTAYYAKDLNTKEYIDTIIYRFTKSGCKLIFLFFPKIDKNVDDWYAYCRQYLQEKNVYYIDVNAKVSSEKRDFILRDSVHTNTRGSKLYANIIYEEFNKNINNIKVAENITATQYTNLKSLKVEKLFIKEILLRGDARIIGILNTIGPFSGIIGLNIDDEDMYKVSLWDEWCYFAREHFNLSFTMKCKANLVILQDKFSTESCKYNIDFNKNSKKFYIHEIYYLGEKLEVLNINDGKKFNKIFFQAINMKARISKVIYKYFHKK